MERIEDIILRHSQRGMTKLRPYMDADYCRLAAEEIYSWKRGVVFLTTGFYVAGYPETDGPTGTAVLASVLRDMGFRLLGKPYEEEVEDAFQEDWIQLLQLDSDTNDYFDLRFYDMGLLYLMIEGNRLKQCDFSHVRPFMTSL